ncbi:MAG: amidohydrolase family protein [Acidobacteria bacterium]|nr:amidohydrolase family protein [Acidobacteriota bacterium]
MNRYTVANKLRVVWWLFLFYSISFAQVPPEVIHYPDLILFDGKVASFEGALLNERVSFSEAIAIRNGRVFVVGTDEEVLKLKGPNTIAIDLDGKTVLPGFADTHNHPNEWVHYFRFDSFLPDYVKYVYIPGPDDVYQQYRPDISWGFGPILEDPGGDLLTRLQTELQKAARELGPGPQKWILALVSRQGRKLFGPVVNKTWLDKVVPNNPVVVSADFIPFDITANSLAIRIGRARDPGPLAARHLNELEKNGVALSAVPLRLYFGIHVIGNAHFREFETSLKYVMLEFAKYGATSIATRVNYTTDLAAHSDLARDGTAPVRVGWSHQLMGLRSEVLDRVDPKLTLPLVGDFAGIGSDLFWNIGVAGEGASDLPFTRVFCTMAQPRENSKYRKEYFPVCGFDPGSRLREAVTEMVANRVRAAQFHGSADKTIDGIMEIALEGMKRGGLTMDDIRKMRITFDHVLLVRPDQPEKLKELGIIPAVTPLYIYQGEEILDLFGPQVEDWMFPIGSFVKAGVPVTINLDRIPTEEVPYFWELQFLITRNFRGKTYNAKEAVDRTTALKTITTWAARYMLRENEVGNLQPGYFADLMVLDRDYFTVAEEQLDRIKVLMTVLGGKITWVDPAVEKELPQGSDKLFHPTFVQFKSRIQGP